MRVKSLKVFVRVLVFGLLLGASSTVYADTVVITSFSFGNLQVTVTGLGPRVHDRCLKEKTKQRLSRVRSE